MSIFTSCNRVGINSYRAVLKRSNALVCPHRMASASLAAPSWHLPQVGQTAMAIDMKFRDYGCSGDDAAVTASLLSCSRNARGLGLYNSAVDSPRRMPTETSVPDSPRFDTSPLTATSASLNSCTPYFGTSSSSTAASVSLESFDPVTERRTIHPYFSHIAVYDVAIPSSRHFVHDQEGGFLLGRGDRYTPHPSHPHHHHTFGTNNSLWKMAEVSGNLASHVPVGHSVPIHHYPFLQATGKVSLSLTAFTHNKASIY